VSQQTVSSANPGDYPQIRAQAADNPVNIWIRANNATDVDQVTPGPFLEYCNSKYLPGDSCTSVFSGSDVHGWAVISRPGPVTGGIGDDFASNSLTGRTAGSTPRWTSIWQTSARTGGGGELLRQNGNVTFRRTSTTNWDNLGNATGTSQPAPAIARAVNLYALQTPVLEFTFTRTGTNETNSTFLGRSALKLDYSFANPITTDQPVQTNSGWVQLATITAGGTVGPSNGASGTCINSGGTYTCRIAFPPAAYQASNRFSHFVKFRLKANVNYITSSQTTGNSLRTVTIDNIAIRSSTANPSAPPQYLNWCEYSPSFPATASFTGGFHCLGPTVDIRSVGNNLWLDTTDQSISFYYNRTTDTRGITAANPLINLFQGGTMSNVICSRANPTSTVPTANCRTLVPENVFNPVGEYDRFNVFGRDTTPANTCIDAGRTNQPCNQIVVIGADSDASSTNRARIAGAWFYMPWGLVSFCVNGCGPIPSISNAFLQQDDSWNFGGRLWVRTILAGGQNHFRVPPSASSSLTQLVGAANSSDVTYIGWEGVDWVARSPSAARRGSLD